jgi:hypothetical protein
MLLERRLISRKTPGDGRIEITARAAGRLRDLGHALEVEVGGDRGTATVQSMRCTCRGDAKPHAHYFLQSPPFTRLTPGTEVDLELDESLGVVRLIMRGPSA